MIKIKRGLNIPIQGTPSSTIDAFVTPRNIGVVGHDYHGMKPTMEVREGDTVQKGQVLFSDKKTPGVHYTAPASGTISAINRGAKRVLQSVVIEVSDAPGIDFGAVTADQARAMGRQEVVDKLVASGLWTALRTRPFSKVPAIDAEPVALFVTAMDTQPLAADPAIAIAEQAEAFALGVDVLAKLTSGKTYVCAAAGANIPAATAANAELATFSGPHPAGLVGTHIHFLTGASAARQVWHIGYQDVIAVGRLLLDGQLYSERVVALSGPAASNPRLVRTLLGADLTALCAGEQSAEEARLVSGSVLGGRSVSGATSYLGRYHNQVTLIAEGRDRTFMGWLSPGAKRHSNMGIYITSFFGTKPLAMTTNTNGSERAMVPVGSYERIMPLDILPTQLLRSLLVGDTETAQQLGCLELDEEDLALCTYVCPGKYEYGPVLRDNLTRIEQEG
jgi:Na+-transporting NADH:ubiquinone oxidoreductase subunit A